MEIIKFDMDKLQRLLVEVINLEKKFASEKYSSEKSKISELKKLIEKEVKL